MEKYARLGYSLLTYKSVRSRFWPAHPKPVLARLRPVGQAEPSASTPLVVDNELTWSLSTSLSSANSVGLPSHNPEEWREDVRYARESLDQGQVLIVSVVGTPEPGGAKVAYIGHYDEPSTWQKYKDYFKKAQNMILANSTLYTELCRNLKSLCCKPGIQILEDDAAR